MSILHIDSSARIHDSNSRKISQYLTEQLDQPAIYRDLASNPLPAISAEDLIAVHGSIIPEATDISASLKSQLDLSDSLIKELNQAENLVIAAPMYNFSVPVVVKQWIDLVARAGHSFRYTEQGPVGLLKTQRAFIITSSGGTPVGSDYDFASRYLEQFCRFVGINEIIHIDASGSKGSPEEVIASAKQQIDKALNKLK